MTTIVGRFKGTGDSWGLGSCAWTKHDRYRPTRSAFAPPRIFIRDAARAPLRGFHAINVQQRNYREIRRMITKTDKIDSAPSDRSYVETTSDEPNAPMDRITRHKEAVQEELLVMAEMRSERLDDSRRKAKFPRGTWKTYIRRSQIWRLGRRRAHRFGRYARTAASFSKDDMGETHLYFQIKLALTASDTGLINVPESGSPLFTTRGPM
ncbi:hypothetical protein Dda_2561 [Drechslerella dactyloides]|uniref:Uncharacterized protein n=1 Tax=Drechslerella dactyloides TaxID=74499 RepID=A0AAD6J453_DREDA|nr:hypothetical protein Dda_2561 [Drechslerella dactyloides]